MKDSHKDSVREAKKLRYLSTIYIINDIENAYKNCILIFEIKNLKTLYIEKSKVHTCLLYVYYLQLFQINYIASSPQGLQPLKKEGG